MIKSIRPEQQIVKIVHDELIELMGPVDPSIRFEKTGPTVLMLCGLQGSGKTTTCGKLARLLAAQNRKPMLVAADLQRPAAVEQLKVIGGQIGVPVFSQAGSDPIAVCQQAVIEANRTGCDTLILDTAGRLHVDDQLMNELAQIEKKVKPHQVFFVCDAMTGQDAVSSADAFNEALELDGVILTKLDGDARGGAALSVRKVTGVPIKFVGKGEKLDRLEPFDPERLVGQMLGMGDIVGLVEAAQADRRRRGGPAPAGEARQGEVRPRRLPQADRQHEEDGLDAGAHEQDPRLEPDADGALGGMDARGGDQADPGDDRQHDAGGTAEPGADRHLAAPADRRRQRRGSVRDLGTGQAVRRHGRHRQADGPDDHDGQAQDDHRPGPGGRLQSGRPALTPKVGTGKRLSPKEREKLRKQREKEERQRRREERNRP